MSKYKIAMTSGSEYDALTRWKNFLRWRAGERAMIKRKFNKRARKTAKKLEE